MRDFLSVGEKRLFYFVNNLIRGNAEKIPQPRHTCLCLHNFREKGDTVGESAKPPIEVPV
jgi:hypothetical protein